MATNSSQQQHGWRVCDQCEVSHIENCGTCFGFGLTPEGKIISAPEAIEQRGGTMQSVACPECGSTPCGLPKEMRIRMTALDLAILFHETYERFAPQFGYETRTDTKVFDPDTPNGQLMVAVCGEIIGRLCVVTSLEHLTIEAA